MQEYFRLRKTLCPAVKSYHRRTMYLDRKKLLAHRLMNSVYTEHYNRFIFIIVRMIHPYVSLPLILKTSVSEGKVIFSSPLWYGLPLIIPNGG